MKGRVESVGGGCGWRVWVEGVGGGCVMGGGCVWGVCGVCGLPCVCGCGRVVGGGGGGGGGSLNKNEIQDFENQKKLVEK